MKKFSLMFLVALISTLFIGCGGSKDTDGGEQKIRFNIAMDTSEDSVTYLYAKKFSDLIKEKSNGRLSAQLYTNGSMGSDREIVESLQAGSLDMAVQTTAPQVNFMPNLAIFDMPGLFKDVDTARKTIDNPELYSAISNIYKDGGIKLLGMADQGFRVMTSNKPVQAIGDMKGIKIRTMENPYHIEYWKALGANPTPMAFSELYIGLQQGMVDAEENPYEVIVAGKLYEQQKYLIKTNHLLHTLTLIANSNRFNALSAEDKKIVEDASKEATTYARDMTDQRIDERIKIMTDSGVEILELDPSVYKDMSERSQVVYKSIEKETGSELVNLFINTKNKIVEGDK